ncbi:hypothetical protein TrVE_jg11283 [Triparma verrucosa]|uniref:RNA helicase n=1 Tax=Triparma verrucosa TaxID=1606542 RepID=A0A9W7KW62_9STRA|nr:hypothetical protein TrVE_jg11283 [Triparma verrucosa]
MPVQESAVPLILGEGKDVLIQSATGSGKTLGYLIPLLQKLLNELESDNNNDATTTTTTKSSKSKSSNKNQIKLLILLPTRDLVDQVISTLNSLLYYLTDQLSPPLSLLKPQKSDPNLHSLTVSSLRTPPQIVVATPLGLLTYTSHLTLSSLTSLVLDESDLMLSHGYASDLTETRKLLPKICQTVLVSATLNESVKELKKVMLHKPAIIKVNKETRSGTLKQFYLPLPSSSDKLLIIYCFLKLSIITGRSLFFTSSTTSCYRLKLFLEQFGIRSGVVGGNMTGRHRSEVVERFNTGGFDVLIAEATEEATEESLDSESESESEADEITSPKKSSKKNTDSSDFGVSRGVDFRGVKYVINVDLPPTSSSYTHRIGRTARAGASGIALTLIDESDEGEMEILKVIQESQPRAEGSKSTDVMTMKEGEVQPARLEFDLKEVEGFRYRVEDVKRAVTKVAITETIQKEIKESLLNSDRLLEHFASNPQDRNLLEADKMRSNINKVQSHLKHVPSYLIPSGMKVAKPSKKRRRRSNLPQTGEKNSEADPLISAPTESRIFLDSNDGTGKSTSGRKQWKMKRGKGKYSKRYDATKFRGKR